MGVHNLWSLLLPISRRISIETLSNKVLAIDASIWLTQFIKAMRDSEGNTTRNAHLLGSLRRILKLLFHHIQPIFVFDGATPAIKLNELRARRERREKQDESLKRTAKRLLVAQLKEKRLLEEEKKRSGVLDNSPSKGAFAKGFVDGDDDDDDDDDDDSPKPKPTTLEVKDSDIGDDSSSNSSVNWEDENNPITEPSWQTLIPQNEDLDMSVVKNLPASMRVDVIEKAKAAARVRSRKEYMPVASDPKSYSSVQLSNFLKSSKLNKNILKLAKEEVDEGEEGRLEGERVASDASKRIVVKEVTKKIDWGENGSSGSSSSEEEEEDVKNIKGKKKYEDDTSKEEEEEEEKILEKWKEEDDEFEVDDCGVLSTFDNYSSNRNQEDSSSDDEEDALARIMKKTREEAGGGDSSDSEESEESIDDKVEEEEVIESAENLSPNLSPLPSPSPPSPPSPQSQPQSPASTNSSHHSWEEEDTAHTISAPQATAFAAAAADAGRLTSWAGRAVKRAIKQHISEVTGGREERIREGEEEGGIEEEEDLRKAIENSKREVGGETEVVEVTREENDLERAIALSKMEEEEEEEDDDDNDDSDAEDPPPRPPPTSTTTTTTSATTPTTTTRKSANPKSKPDQQQQDRARQEELVALAAEQHQLQAQLNKHQRDTSNVTDDMRDEVIELLQLFGLPYVIAPAEAEAQCAELEKNGLVDGIITEDSDVFVFGGKSVYRNIFDERKYVEVYLASDAEKELGLQRHHFVALAMLLGGDYTQGVRGVGIVNGMEVLSAFPVDADPTEGLKKFKTWLDGFDPLDILKGSDVSDVMTEEKRFHQKHKSARNRWEAPNNFPAKEAIHAYMRPVVDGSARPFQWGFPDTDAIEILCANKLGWTLEECDRQLKPVIDKISETSRQMRLENFFTTYEDRDLGGVVKSKRLQSVLKRKVGVVAGVATTAVEEGAKGCVKKKKTAAKKPRAKAVKEKEKEAEVDDDKADDGGSDGHFSVASDDDE
ncbi:hypothetical protein TrLO_g1618 [Triparma laevis f. longispina]|uniref:Uncharacterized protein n=1 Tax=Triparma laevis f. longispina TaxID=1714387 RepID=A0A9W7AE24_9STRA|nr:hypothetical protein TrLO_g1618 [Triparma laevis f. longispina]